MFLALQIAALIAVAGYLSHSRIRLARRNRQSWESLVARLHPGWGGQQSSHHYLWREGITVAPEELWANIDGPHGVWAIFKNAGVLMEMADFAEMNSGTVDQLLLQRLRSDALQIRRCAFMLLARWAVERGGDVVQIKAFLVASMYTGMTARMVQLIEQSAGEALPCFVGAM